MKTIRTKWLRHKQPGDRTATSPVRDIRRFATGLAQMTNSMQSQRIHGAFLELPGEIRNQIYALVIYPELSSIVIANCTKAEHLAASVLHLSPFRICRQIRAECLSYVCANFSLTFLTLQTANLFFSCVGPAISEIKAFVLVQPVIASKSKESRDRVERFLAALEEMDQLAEVVLEKTGKSSALEESEEHGDLMRKVEDLSMRGVKVRNSLGQRLMV
jgi:hypothetical protein